MWKKPKGLILAAYTTIYYKIFFYSASASVYSLGVGKSFSKAGLRLLLLFLRLLNGNLEKRTALKYAVRLPIQNPKGKLDVENKGTYSS